MAESTWLAKRFQENRAHLRAVAYRMLGSESEADDAVQEAWLRLERSDVGGVENLGGWLTTVVARVSLDMLRSRKSRREESADADVDVAEPAVPRADGVDPEAEVQLADSIGSALLVMLETLAPAERVAFVLHDMFDLPFDEIATIVNRSESATRQLASRARRRIQGEDTAGRADVGRKREIVKAFLDASRNGDFDALLAVLDPGVVVRADSAAVKAGASPELRGAKVVVENLKKGVRPMRPALVDGALAGAWVLRGRPRVVILFTIEQDKIVELDVIMNPAHLGQLDVQLLDD